MNIFDRYAPFVQDYIYRNNWESLRAIQVAAGNAIFNTDEHVLLTASTASGKTEAAFFPIITLFSEAILKILLLPERDIPKQEYTYQESLHGTYLTRATGLRAPPSALA